MDRKPGVPNESISMKGKLPTVLTELAATVITTLQRATISTRARHFDCKKKRKQCAPFKPSTPVGLNRTEPDCTRSGGMKD